MRSDRPRHNPATQLLLSFEKRLQRTLSGQGENYKNILKEILSEIESSGQIYSSMEVDRFLQLSMLYIAARLNIDFYSENTEFKVSTSIYNAKHNLLIIKPSYFFLGRCSIRHPTILLHPRQREAPPSSHYIGLSGLVLNSGEVLHCTNLRGRKGCSYYVPLDSPSGSALSIPLRKGFEEAIKRLQETPFPRNSNPTPHCCLCEGGTLQPVPDLDRDVPAPEASHAKSIYGVLNIDCNTTGLDLKKAKDILKEKDLQNVLRAMIDQLAGHEANRPSYRVLRTCSVLFQLSQHTLQARQAYVALLNEVSEICDGADVTLHLRDMFVKPDDKGDEKSNESRSIKLVAGVGNRFRGFLIGERYGDGLVGEAMRKGDLVDLDPDEIRGSLNEESPYKYRRLMPGTDLNMAVPIHFHSRVIGAINIEWDKVLTKELLRKISPEEYFEFKRPALRRLAGYLSLVIDYFDDSFNPMLEPDDETARDGHYKRSLASRRRVLAYYVDSALKRIDGDLQIDSRRAGIVAHHYLRDIIDAIGYFLTFENKHRVLASIRRKEKQVDGDYLVLVYAHGFDEEKAKGKGPGGPIRIAAGQSVLGTSAQLGIPIFGTVEDSKILKRDILCYECAPIEDRKVLDRPINYKPAGHRPVYEVGVPLVFGNEGLGTFDFELFSLDSSKPEAVEPLAIKGHELAPFLEWVRAITFCMAYAEDALHPEEVLSGLSNEHRSSYRRFQRLCAQIIANVAIPEDLLTPIAEEYLRGLIPLCDLTFEPPPDIDEGPKTKSTNEEESSTGRVTRKTRDLWSRGQHLGSISLSLYEEMEPPRSIFPEASLETGTGRLAESFIAALYTAALSADQRREFESTKFKLDLEAIQASLSEKIARKKQDNEFAEADPYEVIDTYFTLLDEALRDRFQSHRGAVGARQTGRLGWFLYMARCVEDTVHGDLAVLRCGTPFARWAAMNTQEMRTLISRVLESPEGEKTFAQIVGHDLAKEALEARSTNSGTTSWEDLFVEALARRDREYPDPTREQKPSLTTTMARLKRALTVADLNRSPVRSERKREWFFRDQPYCVVGVPIQLGDKCIGVLQIFRRRESIDDALFFKNDEIEALRRLGTMMEDEIAKEIKYLDITLLRDVTEDLIFSPAIQALGAQLGELIVTKKSPIVVVCDFLDDRRYCDQFIAKYVKEEYRTLTLRELKTLGLKLEKMSYPVVCVLFSEAQAAPEIKEELRILTNELSDCTVVIFVSPGEEMTVADMLPSIAHPLTQERDDPEKILPVAFGIAEGREENGQEDLRFLFRDRPKGPWTVAQLMEDCGGTAGLIRKRAPMLLSSLKAHKGSQRRLLTNWYQHKGSLG